MIITNLRGMRTSQIRKEEKETSILRVLADYGKASTTLMAREVVGDKW
jgi:hypothetical protein